MSSAPAYHHGDLRAALVEVGLELARESGPDGVVVREAARRVGVSHNAAYRHFADRDALLAGVADGAQHELADAMRAALAALPRPRDPALRARRRLRALGETYVAFAVAEPGLFRVAFTGGAEGPAGAEPFEMLGAALDDLVATGLLPAERRPGAEMMCWSGVHGFAVLTLDGPLQGLTARDRAASLTAMIDEMERGMTAPT